MGLDDRHIMIKTVFQSTIKTDEEMHDIIDRALTYLVDYDYVPDLAFDLRRRINHEYENRANYILDLYLRADKPFKPLYFEELIDRINRESFVSDWFITEVRVV